MIDLLDELYKMSLNIIEYSPVTFISPVQDIWLNMQKITMVIYVGGVNIHGEWLRELRCIPFKYNACSDFFFFNLPPSFYAPLRKEKVKKIWKKNCTLTGVALIILILHITSGDLLLSLYVSIINVIVS